jgi:hypothetical protein
MTPEQQGALREQLLENKPFLKELYDLSAAKQKRKKLKLIQKASEDELNLLGEIFHRITTEDIPLKSSQQKDYTRSRKNNYIFRTFDSDGYDAFKCKSITDKRDIIRKVSCFHCLLHALFVK